MAVGLEQLLQNLLVVLLKMFFSLESIVCISRVNSLYQSLANDNPIWHCACMSVRPLDIPEEETQNTTIIKGLNQQ